MRRIESPCLMVLKKVTKHRVLSSIRRCKAYAHSKVSVLVCRDDCGG